MIATLAPDEMEIVIDELRNFLEAVNSAQPGKREELDDLPPEAFDASDREYAVKIQGILRKLK